MNSKKIVPLELINQSQNGKTNRMYIHENTWIFGNRIANRIKVKDKSNRKLVIDLQPDNRIIL